ncbi:ABC transporter substrate-binding protein [Cohnella faecalis]|uniref:ABC transporter substrate-binding protein n=2 Tax=Cohnella faecalis TaxID=2315694 RepID=A0A398CLL9_9BACL|nr:ABC transporter substrate-binding protein [Cohnella faecalis]
MLIPTILLAGVMTGCGAMNASQDASEGKLVVEDFAGRKVAFDETPKRIVALGNGELDIVYALKGTLVGRPDDHGSLPNEAAREVPIVGSVHTVDLEKIAALRPDVVLGNHPINDNDIPKLERIGVKLVLTQANSIEDIRREILLLGKMLGKETLASETVDVMNRKLADIKGRPKGAQRALVVYGAPGTYLAALPNSLAGNLLETAGGYNVASDFPSLQNFPQYAQLNAERVIEANPDLILVMTHGDSEEVEKGFVREMESNPAWNSLAAVRNKRIHVLPSELFGTNPGTRAAEAVERLAELLEP